MEMSQGGWLLFVPAWLGFGWLAWIVWFDTEWQSRWLRFLAETRWSRFLGNPRLASNLLWSLRIIYPLLFVLLGYVLLQAWLA